MEVIILWKMTNTFYESISIEDKPTLTLLVYREFGKMTSRNIIAEKDRIETKKSW